MSITFCDQCHGVTAITYSTNNAGYEESKEVLPVGPLKFCCGHGPPQGGSVIARPASKHDGQLDQYPHHGDHAWTSYRPNYREDSKWKQLVVIYGGYGDCESNEIILDSKQALSLLAWLKQEEETLKRLAGGDEGHA